MAKQTVNIGSSADDGTGDSGRVAFDKVNDNFTEVYPKYTSITTSEHDIADADLIFGMNIFGVNFAGAVTVYLPEGIDASKILVINDESGSASSNNITVTLR